MSKQRRLKWEKRKSWPLSRGARLRRVLPVHQRQIDALIEDRKQADAESK